MHLNTSGNFICNKKQPPFLLGLFYVIQIKQRHQFDAAVSDLIKSILLWHERKHVYIIQ